MQTTTITLHTKFRVGQVDPRIFSGFLEHLGRAIYQGVYDPDCRYADEDGFRKDVLQALAKMDMSMMRYPGGNFASGYHWQDGIGPKEKRPRHYDLAWKSIESNQFGTDEFMHLCRKMKWDPYITVNLGTGTPEEARNWVEYCNISPGTTYADMRAANGYKEPYNVRYWGLGNEMDGPWQLGQVPVKDYAVKAKVAAKMMKDLDNSIEVIACGSSGFFMNTFPEWDREVLEYLGDDVDYISLHQYLGNDEDDTPVFMAKTKMIDYQIETINALCLYIKAKLRSNKRIYLCFDEWNVWYKDRDGDGSGKFAPHLLEEIYNLEDALVVAGYLNSFIRHADAVKIANIAQIVNVIAPIITRGDDMLIQSTLYPFAMFSKRRNGISLQLQVEGPGYQTKEFGTVDYIDASVILGNGCIHAFVCNRNMTDEAEVRIKISDAEIVSLESGELLTGPGSKSANSFDNPELIKTVSFADVRIIDGSVCFEIPPLGIIALTINLS